MTEPVLQVPPRVIECINKAYPKPRVDPVWIQDCYQWLVEDGTIPDGPQYTSMIEKIEEQLHKSDLFDSTMEGTGLPAHVGEEQTSMRLTGPPVLVQITDMTDVGVSAFQLEQVRKAREERMQATGGVGGMEDGEGEGADLEIEGDEGPMPKYPRGTLMMHISDGNTVFRAMEYKPLPQLSLISTPLGYKLQLKDVRVVCGIAHLEPKNVILKGGNMLENEIKEFRFKQGLRLRMGMEPEPVPVPRGVDGGNAQQPQEAVPGPQPQPPARIPSPPPAQPRINNSAEPPTVSPYFSNPSLNSSGPQRGAGTSGIPLSPTLREIHPTLPEPSASPNLSSDFDFDDWDALNEIENAAIAKSQQAPPPPPQPTARLDSPPHPAVAGPSRRPDAPAEPEDIIMASVEDESDLQSILLPITERPTEYPRLLTKPVRAGEKIQLTAALSKALARDQDESDYMDDDMFGTLDSDDLRRIEDAEKEAVRGTALSSFTMGTSSSSAAGPSRMPRATATPPPVASGSKPASKRKTTTSAPAKRASSRTVTKSKVSPPEVITITDSESDCNEEVGRRQAPVRTQRSSQPPRTQPRPRTATQRKPPMVDPGDIIELSD